MTTVPPTQESLVDKALSQPIEKDSVTPSSWETFYSKFTPTEKQVFLRNQSHLIAQQIQRNLRKMRETIRKTLRENS